MHFSMQLNTAAAKNSIYKRNRNAKPFSFKKVLALIHAQTGHRHRPFYPLEYL
jgi:hypothetical protein